VQAGLMTSEESVIKGLFPIEKVSIPRFFFRNIDVSEEFGVSRFLTDRIAYLSRLLEKMSLEYVEDCMWVLFSEIKDSRSNSIRLEHRFQATSLGEAERLYAKISSRLAGIELKIWLACWKVANDERCSSFNCRLADLMNAAYPETHSYFSSADKISFFVHLRNLESTKFIFSTPFATIKRRVMSQTIELPLLRIVAHVGLQDGKYPEQLTISLMNLDVDVGKMAYVGAAFKNKTLELHPDDTQLATWIQSRKSQLREESVIQADLEFLFAQGGFAKTALSNRGHAKTLLKNKLRRLQDKGVICSFPERLEEMVLLKIR
jgi:hypothetical protein